MTFNFKKTNESNVKSLPLDGGLDIYMETSVQTRIDSKHIELDSGSGLFFLPSCCGYAVYGAVMNDEDDIKTDTELLLKQLEINKDKKRGFGAVITFQVYDSIAEKLIKNGWKTVNSIRNYGSDNIITQLILTL
jgi:hypothetical protein